ALARVANPFVLVRVRRAEGADFGRRLADLPLIGAADHEVGLLFYADPQPFRNRILYGVRITQGQQQRRLGFDFGPIADADDVQMLFKPLPDSAHGIGHDAARQAVQIRLLWLLTPPPQPSIAPLPP